MLIRRQLKPRRGFTLTEVLIAVVILSIVSIAATGLFFAFTKHFEQSSDLTAARQRGEMVLSRLETAVLQAGLSMPNKTSDFEKVFVVGTSPKIDLITALRTATGSVWNEPVYLYGEKFSVTNADGSETEYFRKMGIVYCLSSGIGVLEDEHDIDVNKQPVLKLSAACPDNQVKAATSAATTDGWVTFSGCQTPFVVKEISTDRKELTVMISKRDLIPFFAELQYVRALCAYVDSPGGTSPHFYVEDVTRSPAQPVSEGVSQVLFSFDDDSNVLTVHLLVRGNRKFPGEVTSGDVPGWPLTGTDTTVTSEDRHYRLVAMSASWRVRN
ncbi:type II secretion system protein [Acetomicrobium sp.]|uniref:PilW family protein n=1 Tax=Acetomicrobium sp. TaxID=1872099 RepID=UPI002B262FC9|nr:type II secretion system protein [Acetomicrobium sp.]